MLMGLINTSQDEMKEIAMTIADVYLGLIKTQQIKVQCLVYHFITFFPIYFAYMEMARLMMCLA